MSTDVKPRYDYEFIDGIRALAMISIVAEHCITACAFDPQKGTSEYYTYLTMIQFTKFGTIIFFLIAGFLMGDKFNTYSPIEYYRRRLVTVAGPWVFWTIVYVLALMIELRWVSKYYYTNSFILSEIEKIFLYSNYWFVLNYLLSIGILLVFRRQLYSYRLGGILAVFTLFYAINVHFEWIPANHTTAVFGFILFIWIGAQLRKNWVRIESKLYSIPYLPLVCLLLFFAILGILESSGLYQISGNPFNTLRLSNIFFCLSAFLLLLRIGPVRAIRKLQPRRTTYGIYLTHYLLIVFLLPKVVKHLHIDVLGLNAWHFVIYCSTVSVCIYGLSFALVDLIGKTRARVLVGIQK